MAQIKTTLVSTLVRGLHFNAITSLVKTAFTRGAPVLATVKWVADDSRVLTGTVQTPVDIDPSAVSVHLFQATISGLIPCARATVQAVGGTFVFSNLNPGYTYYIAAIGPAGTPPEIHGPYVAVRP